MTIGLEAIASTHGRNRIVMAIKNHIDRLVLGEPTKSFFLRPRNHRLPMITLDPEISSHLTVRHRIEPNRTPLIVNDLRPQRSRLTRGGFRSHKDQTSGRPRRPQKNCDVRRLRNRFSL
jgi:hypothetical protein